MLDTKEKNTVKSKAQKLHCSACLVECTIESFMSHLTSVHKSRNAQESFSTFDNPVLLPKNRFQLPKQLEDTIHYDDGNIWDCYCEQCNIYNGNIQLLEKHISSYHKTAPLSDKDCTDLCCVACATTLNTIVGKIACTRSKSNDERTASISEIECIEDRRQYSLVRDTEDSTIPTRSSLSPRTQPTNLTSNNETLTPADSTLGSSTVIIPYNGSSTSTRPVLGSLTDPTLDNELSSSIVSTLDPSEVETKLLPDTNDPNHFCRVCDRKYQSDSTYHVHLIRIHGIRDPNWRMRRILHPDVVPDIKNQDLFCAACERYFRTPITFACHIANVHNISFSNSEIPKRKYEERAGQLKKNKQRKKHRKPFNSLVLPCVKDPQFYCARCDWRYATKLSFIVHLKKVHSFRIHQDDFKDYTDFSGDSIWRCLLCTKALPDRDSLNAHVRLIHNFRLAPHSSINDFTCYLCKKEYYTTRDAVNHLIHVHGIQPAVKLENRNELPPSLSLPLRSQVQTAAYSEGGESSVSRNLVHECSACGNRFSNKYELGCHKEDYHDSTFIYDADKSFCSLCDSSFISKYTYRNHLRSIHLIDELPPVSDKKSDTDDNTHQVRNTISKEEENITIVKVKDEANPNENTFNLSKNAYCEICDLSYSTMVHYRLHCFKYHRSG